MSIFKGKRPNPRSVLFVCSANATRSPAAAALFRKIATEAGEKWDIASAGVEATPDSPPTTVIANEVRRRWRLSIYDHRTRPVTRALLDRYYWIIAMTRSQKARVLRAAPEIADRVLLLKEIGGASPADGIDVPDPTGREAADFSGLFALFEEAVPHAFRVLQTRASDLDWERKHKRE